MVLKLFAIVLSGNEKDKKPHLSYLCDRTERKMGITKTIREKAQSPFNVDPYKFLILLDEVHHLPKYEVIKFYKGLR